MLQESDNLWWDAFATEFFEDDATLTLTFCLEDGPKRYSEYPPLRRIVSQSLSALFFFSRFFSKKPGIVSPYSVVLANAGNAFAKKLGGDGGEDTSPVARFSFGTTRLFSTVHCPRQWPVRTRLHTHSK